MWLRLTQRVGGFSIPTQDESFGKPEDAYAGLPHNRTPDGSLAKMMDSTSEKAQCNCPSPVPTLSPQSAKRGGKGCGAWEHTSNRPRGSKCWGETRVEASPAEDR